MTRGLDENEFSVTLYHEILEAAVVASLLPPVQTIDLNEADFERIAYQTFAQLGEVSLENINRMLQAYGF